MQMGMEGKDLTSPTDRGGPFMEEDRRRMSRGGWKAVPIRVLVVSAQPLGFRTQGCGLSRDLVIASCVFLPQCKE